MSATDHPRFLAELGAHDAAFQLLEQSLWRDRNAYQLLFFAAWDDLRGDPRTMALIERMGIADLWRKIGPPPSCRAVGNSFECD